ncbi:polysaccharide biosynthesis tyrosine autokinase [Deinococcus aquiradiocola]|uniref:ExoP n=1 Tax=Deinococcus aquiradiocola TaxID=393059 RepID=A0A917UQR7_9DEIO|nr:tyrosine-protein kinase domain-containing protein [Deinococcus aquiradiocola]GGJ78187.1 exoP [Deinococcus aquiradiocola]
MQTPVPPVRPDEIDLRQVFSTLKRAALPIVGATLLVGGATYALSRQQPKMYASVSSVLAAQDASQNTLINNTLVTAPPLPQGAVDEAIHSRSVVDDISKRLQVSGLDAGLIAHIESDLTREIASQKFKRVSVKAKLDPQQRGVYEISSTAESPRAAQVLADAAVHALLAWDTARAQTGVKRARGSLEAQLRDLDARIAATLPGSVDRQSLLTTRGQVTQNLAQVAVFEQAASGPLSLVADANEPNAPISPKPTRDALLAALLTLFAASGVALLTDSLRRRVNGPEDLMEFGYPVLAQLPALRQRALLNGVIQAARSGNLYEAVGFLRLNLMNAPHTGEQRRFVVSSSRPGEGKSSVTAILADAFAGSGLKVLLIDADMYRATQHQLWRADPNLQLGAPALLVSKPDVPGARPVKVTEQIDLIPAGSHRNASSVINNPGFSARLDRWSQGYDVVIIDTPPLGSVSDALALASMTDGLLFVVEAGQTREAEVGRAMQNLQVAGTPVLGFVLNKTTNDTRGYYAYSYTTREPSGRPGEVPGGAPRF